MLAKASFILLEPNQTNHSNRLHSWLTLGNGHACRQACGKTRRRMVPGKSMETMKIMMTMMMT